MFENPGVHIARIISETVCSKHRAAVGIPCWAIESNVSSYGLYRAVCGKRIKRAGFIGKISPQSMRLKSDFAKQRRPHHSS